MRVTEEQEAALVLRATQNGVTVSRLMVESALSGGAEAAQVRAEVTRELAGELFRVSRLLGKTGVNINQIARATNITFEEHPDTVAAVRAHGEVCARLAALLDSVERQV